MLRQETSKAFEVLAVGNKNAITALDEIENYLKSFLPKSLQNGKHPESESCCVQAVEVKPAKAKT